MTEHGFTQLILVAPVVSNEYIHFVVDNKITVNDLMNIVHDLLPEVEIISLCINGKYIIGGFFKDYHIQNGSFVYAAVEKKKRNKNETTSLYPSKIYKNSFSLTSNDLKRAMQNDKGEIFTKGSDVPKNTGKDIRSGIFPFSDFLDMINNREGGGQNILNNLRLFGNDSSEGSDGSSGILSFFSGGMVPDSQLDSPPPPHPSNGFLFSSSPSPPSSSNPLSHSNQNFSTNSSNTRHSSSSSSHSHHSSSQSGNRNSTGSGGSSSDNRSSTHTGIGTGIGTRSSGSHSNTLSNNSSSSRRGEGGSSTQQGGSSNGVNRNENGGMANRIRHHRQVVVREDDEEEEEEEEDEDLDDEGEEGDGDGEEEEEEGEWLGRNTHSNNNRGGNASGSSRGSSGGGRGGGEGGGGVGRMHTVNPTVTGERGTHQSQGGGGGGTGRGAGGRVLNQQERQMVDTLTDMGYQRGIVEMSVRQNGAGDISALIDWLHAYTMMELDD